MSGYIFLTDFLKLLVIKPYLGTLHAGKFFIRQTITPREIVLIGKEIEMVTEINAQAKCSINTMELSSSIEVSLLFRPMSDKMGQ